MVNEFEVDGAHGVLRVISWGDGPVPLLALTPVGAEWLGRAFPDDLAATFTIYVLELPGTGRSAGGPEAATVDAAVEAVRVTVDALALERVVLFGHSMNGTLALAAAAAGVACLGVVAVGAVPSLPPDSELSAIYWDEKAEPGRKEVASAAEAAFEAANSDEEKLAAWQAYNNVRRWYDPAVDRSDLDATGNLSQEWIQGVFGDGSTKDWPSVIASVEQPVLLVLGDYDFVAPPTAWTPTSLPPAATVEYFGRSGHTPFVEQPGAFVAAVERWLGTLG